VVIKSGDKVPADLRLLHTANLQIQEAMLTGESVPVSKTLDAVKPESGLVSDTGGNPRCFLLWVLELFS
jgi:P-type E1-E2 ATPase